MDDLKGNTSYSFEVRAENEVRAGAAASMSATTPAADRPPEFTAGPTDPTVDENKTRVGEYAATDPDGDPIQWSLEGTNVPAFELVDGSADTTRVLQFKTAPDFEEQSRYSVTVKVSSSAGEGEGGGGTPLSATRASMPMNGMAATRRASR